MSSLNFYDLLSQYELEKLPRPATVKSYRSAINVFVRDMSQQDPGQVTFNQLLQWRKDVLSRATGTTWNSYLRQLRAVVAFAAEKGYLEENVFEQIGYTRQVKKRKKTVEQNTLKKALQTIRANPSRYDPSWFWESVLETLYYTGIRRRQLVELYWEDLDFQANTILLRSETSKTRREWVIPMFQAEACLRELRKRTWRKNGGGRLSGQVFKVSLFNDKYKSSELKVHNVSALFRKINDDLPTSQRISSHRLRHTFGTITAQAGDIKAVQEILGHADIRTTCEYVHPDLEQLNKIGNTMPKLEL